MAMQSDAVIESRNPQHAIGNSSVAPSGASNPLAPATKAETSGYPVEIYEGEVDEKFCCGYCKLLLRNPMQSTCGHRFCQYCVEVMKTLPEPIICDSCKKDEEVSDEESVLVVNDMFEDKAARREMRKLPVRCIFSNCNWKGTFNDFIEHEEKCEKKMVLCSQCNVFVSKAKLTNHINKSCPKRTLSCEYCDDTIIFENTENHYKVCPMFTIKCEGCDQKIVRKDEAEHKVTKCKNRIISCPVPSCKRELPLNEFLDHLGKAGCEHMAFILEMYPSILKRLKELEASIDQLTNTSVMTTSTIPVPEPVPAIGSASDTPEKMEGERLAGDGAQEDSVFRCEDRQKLRLHEDLMTVLHGEILRCITNGEALGRSMEKEEKRVRDLYTMYDALSVKSSEVENRCSVIEQSVKITSDTGDLSDQGNGVFLWKVSSFSAVRRNACNNYQASVSSPCFFSEPSGYKMKMTLFPDGRGKSKGKYISLFLEVVDGPFDDLLVWPFSGKVQFMLIDHKEFVEHHTHSSSVPDQPPSARGPSSMANIDMGSEEFILTSAFAGQLESFIVRDTIYLKVRVDPSSKIKGRMAQLEFK